MPKGKVRNNKQKTCRSFTTKARPPRGKKAIRKRVSADAFSRRAFLSLRVFCSARLSGCVSVDFRRELVCGGA